jgi:hypothetical protein
MNRILPAFAILLGFSSMSFGQDIYGGRSLAEDLIRACGSKGLVANFVTGNCVSPQGREINPRNLYLPFAAPLPKPDPNELIMRCGAQGRVADFVTGRCM